MSIINIYNGINNEHETIAGKTGELKSILPVFDFNAAVIIKAGERLTPEYIVQPDDVIYIRRVPSGWIIEGLNNFFTKVNKTVNSYFNKESVSDIQEKAQRDAENLAAAVTQLPFIKGAKNQSALGQPLQYLIGRMYNTPYKLTDAFYTIDGTDGASQYLNILLSLGASAQQITEVRVGDTAIKTDAAGIASGVSSFDDTNKYYDANNRLEIRQPGEDITLITQGVKSHYVGAEVKHDYGEDAEPVVYTLDDYTQAVEIGLEFKSLREYDSDHSTWIEKEVEVVPSWSNKDDPDPDNEDDWNAFSFEGFTDNKIKKNTNHTIRYKAVKTFTAAEAYGKTITIRIVKKSVTAESNTQETPYVTYYNCFLYDNEDSSATALTACKPAEEEITSRTARLALRIIANDSTSDTLDEIHTVSTGLARTWTGSDWTTEKTATRNPAAWILELLTTDVHAHSQYTDDELDLASLGELYEYCEDPLGDGSLEYYSDALLTSAQKKDDIINNILTSCEATKFINRYGLIEFAIDRKEDTPVALLNAQNITGISYTKDLSDKADGKKVTFIDGDSFQTSTVYIMRDNKTREADDRITTLNLEYVTTYAHAAKLAQKELRSARLQPRTITVDVGREGDYYPLYSKILLQYQVFRQGLKDSQVEEITGFTITLKDLVTIETGKRYGVIIQAQTDAGRRFFYREVTATAGSTRSLTFTEEIKDDGGVLPQYANIVSFGELDDNGNFDKITNAMKIYGIEPNSDGGYTLTLKDYNAAVYELGTIPAYKPNLTTPPKAAATIPEVTRQDLNDAISHTDEAINNFYSSHTITLYKRASDSPTAAGITSALIYSFAENTLTWEDESGANGWKFTFDEVEEGTGQVYITQATAYGKTPEDTVEANEWARPVPFAQDGTNGYNSYTIQLFRRYAGTPPKPTTALIYDFSTSTLSGELAGWSRSIPAVDEDNLPCYEIHATALSTTDTDTIEPDEWPDPEQILKDSNITLAEVQELINNAAPPPVASAEITAASFMTDDDGKITVDQSITIPFHVRQTGEELQFTFGEIDLPEGFTYSTDGNKLTITATKGAKVTGGNINVPVEFYAYKSNVITVDEDGRYYIADNVEIIAEISEVEDIPADPEDTNVLNWTGSDTTSELVDGGLFEENTAYQYNEETGLWKKFDFTPYGYVVFEDTATVFNIGIAYSQVKGGSNLGPVNDIKSATLTGATIGDYITWTGTTTQSTLQTEGTFKAGAVYTWNGIQWDIDTSDNHTALSLDNILDVGEAELEQNNSKAVGFFAKIAANEIVAAKLTVAGSAFMQKLYAANIYSDIFTSYDEAAQEYASQAQSNAEATAAADASSKAGTAKSEAISAAALDATTKANSAKSEAISTAASDASSKADAAQAAAISTASADAQTKADAAQSAAEANAAADAKTKADTAEANAKSYADSVGSTSKSGAETTASGYVKSALEALGLSVNNDRTIVKGSKISTGLINASALVITGDETLGDTLADLDDDLQKKAYADNVYTKTETDSALEAKADSTDVYTKTETDAALEEKADADDVYTADETDNLLKDKADTSSVYTKTETDKELEKKANTGDSYTKEEEDGKLGAKADTDKVYDKETTDGLLNGKTDTSAAIVETKIIYYKKTTTAEPGAPDHATIKTTDTADAWLYVIPSYTDGATYYTAAEYTHADGSYSYTAASVNNELAKHYAATHGVAIIAGGYIGADLVHADSIEAGSIEADHISAGAITAEKLDAGAVTADAIDAGAITADKIDTGAVTADKLDAKAVTAEKIDTDSLKATTGFFDNIEADGAKFTNVEVSGTIKGNSGYFEGAIGKIINLSEEIQITENQIVIDMINYKSLNSDTFKNFNWKIFSDTLNEQVLLADLNFYGYKKNAGSAFTDRTYVKGFIYSDDIEIQIKKVTNLKSFYLYPEIIITNIPANTDIYAIQTEYNRS